MATRGAIHRGAVARRPRGSRARPARARRPDATPSVRRGRVAYLDNLKVVLVAAIIAAHSLLGYSGFSGAWPYQSVREVRLGAVSQALVAIPVMPAVLFAMGLFFLMWGWSRPDRSRARAPRRFARDRLVRLGVPLAVWTLVVWPGAKWVAYLAAGESQSFWWRFMHSKPFLDPGPMWFVEVLLIYSLGYAAWRQWRRRHANPFAPRARPAADGGPPRQGRALVLLAVGISLATVLVRPAFPFVSAQIGQVKLWQWPQYLGMFGLGIVVAQRGWLDPVPARIRRRCGQAVLLSLVALGLGFAATALAGYNTNVFGRRLHWAPTLLAGLEGPLVVGTCVWLLGFAQQHLNRPPGARGYALARSAFAAFVLQGLVIIGLEIALRPVGVPAEVKAIIVACGAVAGSFSLAWLLVSRTPIGRIL